jgi:hypothetical protein
MLHRDYYSGEGRQFYFQLNDVVDCGVLLFKDLAPGLGRLKTSVIHLNRLIYL